MAQAFSTKQFFKKINQPVLLTEFYKTHSIESYFEITENTSRKNAIAILMDFHASLSPEQKIITEEEFAKIFTLGNDTGVYIIEKLQKEKSLSIITTIECHSDLDIVMYHFLFSNELFKEALFIYQFYKRPNYMLYEAKMVDLISANLALTEFEKECRRISNKEDQAAECTLESSEADGVLYVFVTFDVVGYGKRELRIAYMSLDKEVLISYQGPKYEKLLYLDTFLRVVCQDGYSEKMETFDLSPFKNSGFDFAQINKGVPLLRFKVKAVTFSYGEEKNKKKLRLTLPSHQSDNGLSPLFDCLKEIGVEEKFKGHTVENITLSFTFSDRRKGDKSVNIPTSLSPLRSSLCPLLPYHKYARTLLKQAHIEKGFIEAAKKEKEEVAKKWEV